MNHRLSNLLQFSRRRTKAAESVECLLQQAVGIGSRGIDTH